MSADTTQAPALRKGSSGAKFLQAARDGGWDVDEPFRDPDARGITVIEARWPEPVPAHSLSRIEGRFETGSGVYLNVRRSYRQEDGTDRRKYEGRNDPKVSTIIACDLSNGPKARAEQAAKKAAEKAAGEARAEADRAANLAARDTLAAQRLRSRTAEELNSLTRELRENLTHVMERCAEALADIEAGRPTHSFGGGLFGGNHIVWHSHEAAAKRDLLLRDVVPALEAMWGPLPDPWYSV